MATFAARKSREVADNVRRIVAIELLAACQGIEFRRPLASSQALEAVHAQVRSEVPATMRIAIWRRKCRRWKP